MDFRVQLFVCLLVVEITGQTAKMCPLECSCYLDNKGRNVVECKRGGLTGPLFRTNMSSHMEILKISAPEKNLNDLSMSPEIGNYKKLEEVHIVRSNIPNLGDHFFFGLNKLEVLNLSQNNITQPLPTNFYGLKQLKELYLDDNRIDSLPSATFMYLFDLRVLSLQKNRIQKMMTGVFRNLNKLRVLKLNGNFIDEFNSEVFRDIKELRVFECRGCSVTRLDPKVLDHLPYLAYLDLGENRIKSISGNDLQSLTHLKVLKLDSNQITTIPSQILANHTEMKKLNVARNQIHRIAADAFDNLLNLTELDLSYNKLKYVDEYLLKPVSDTLERLVLSGNQISLKEIRSLLVECSLKDLQLADAGLADIEFDFVPSSVNVLNLGGNQLTYLPAFVLPNNLSDLDLSRNMFRGLDAPIVEKIKGMKSCRLENNPWSCDLCHIVPMLEGANRSEAIFKVRCALPYHHVNKKLGTLERDQLSWCTAAGYTSEGANLFLSRSDGRLGIIAAGASLILLILTVLTVLAALCYSRRHAANYYTHEEKRADDRESIFENPSPLFGEELSFKFPFDAAGNDIKIPIATIDEIKKEHGVPNGT